MSDELPWVEAGCSRRECKDGHTRRWGRCAYGVEPLPTLCRFDLATLADGETFGTCTEMSIEQVAGWLREQGFTVTPPPSLNQVTDRPDDLDKFIAHQRATDPEFRAAYDRRQGTIPEALSSSIECVLFDHHKELEGDEVDANLAELAHVYRQLTGYDALEEIAHDEAHAALEERFKDASTWTEETT